MSTFTPEAPAQTPIADENIEHLLITLDEPSCEYGALSDVIPACGKPSEWLMAVSCGDSAYLCDEHRQRLRKTTESPKPMGCFRHPDRTVTVEWRRVA